MWWALNGPTVPKNDAVSHRDDAHLTTSQPGRIAQWLLLAVICAAFALRVYRLDFQSLWRDEVDAIAFARRDWPAMFAMFTRRGENGPLYFLLLRPWLALVGDSEFAVRFSSVISGVLAVPLSYALGRKLLTGCVADEAPGGPMNWAPFGGALLVACSPYLIWYSQESKMYALLLCLTALAIWLLWSALREGRPACWIGYVVVASLSFYTHILAVALLPVHAAIFAAGGRAFWRRWRPALLSFACLTLPYLPLARWQVPTLLSSFETGHPFYPLPDMLQVLFRALSFGFRAPGLLEICTIVFLLLVGSFLYRCHAPAAALLVRRPQLVLWLYLLMPVVVVYLISLGMPIFADRYLIAVAAPFCLLLACGLEALRTRSRLLCGLCLIAVLSISGQGLWVQAHTTLKADFRSAAAYFAGHASPEDLVIVHMPYIHRNFEYYYRQAYRRADGLYTNAGLPSAEVAERMASLTAGRQVIWLLKSEAEMWDRRNLVQQWLDEHLRLTAEAHFQRVDLYRYENF